MTYSTSAKIADHREHPIQFNVNTPLRLNTVLYIIQKANEKSELKLLAAELMISQRLHTGRTWFEDITRLVVIGRYMAWRGHKQGRWSLPLAQAMDDCRGPNYPIWFCR